MGLWNLRGFATQDLLNRIVMIGLCRFFLDVGACDDMRL